MRQRTAIILIIVACFTVGLVGTLRWRQERATPPLRVTEDRILTAMEPDNPSEIPAAIAPPASLPPSSAPAPLAQPQEPQGEFTPVMITRVATPASWSANPAVQRMEDLLAVGRIQEAEAALRPVSSADAVTEYYAGVFDAWRGRRETAEAHLRVAQKDVRVAPYAKTLLDVYPFFDTFSDGQTSFLDVLVSRALLVNGEVEIGRDKLRFVTSKDAGYADAWILLGAAELLLNHPDAAAEALRRTLPTSKPSVYEWLGLALTADRNFAEAVAFFRQALQRGASPAWRIHQHIAECQLAAEDATAAASSYEQMLSSCASDRGCSLVDLSIRPVWVYLEFLKQPERGLDLARRALAAEPQSAMAENLVGWALIRLRRDDEARTHIAAALRLDPKLAAAHLNAGTLAWLAGDTNGARAAFTRAASLDPNGAVGAQAKKNLTVLVAALAA